MRSKGSAAFRKRNMGKNATVLTHSFLRSGRGLLENALDSLGDGIDICHAIQRHQFALFAVISGQRRSLFAIFRQTLAESLRIVIRTDSAASSNGLGDAVFDSANQSLFVHFQLNHSVENEVLLAHVVGKRLRLRNGARITVENETLGTVRSFDTFGDDLIDDIVGYQPAGVHDGLGALADFGARADRSAQHVTG
ncbi:hypothetical protein AT6N2_C0219 [Agrobacterium tumefaciens]|nr:hypothetical protein AT6N2_C0219 [Agrobacterium tumefaciens]